MPNWINRVIDWSFTPVFVAAIITGQPILWVTFAVVAIILFINSFKNKGTGAEADDDETTEGGL